MPATALDDILRDDPDKLWLDQPLVARRSVSGAVLRLRTAADLARAGELGELARRTRRALNTRVARRARGRA